MGEKQRAYLSLGSNMGNRALTLQKAVLSIQRKAGQVIKVSSIYKSSAMGFKGEDFLNACIAIDTQNPPEQLLGILLQIEKDFGRERSSTKGYSSRTL
ncbi:MAG: 2-amino-4-hydroxy-6-hydroxymethyldihydropteridine diphosphokinase, partial [Bacteroidota bacterium]